jgi:Uma2 family endonuclease
MSTATISAEVEWGFDDLRRIWVELDAPEGWRTEIHGGEITMNPPPAAPHAGVAELIQHAVYGAVPDGAGVFQMLGVLIPTAQRLLIPDLVVAPRDVVMTSEQTLDCRHALLVVEITSPSTAARDRADKKSAYALGGIPLYLLTDRYDNAGPTVTLFSDPAGDDYQHAVSAPFGDTITIPAPFDVVLETATFPRPRAAKRPDK